MFLSRVLRSMFPVIRIPNREPVRIIPFQLHKEISLKWKGKDVVIGTPNVKIQGNHEDGFVYKSETGIGVFSLRKEKKGEISIPITPTCPHWFEGLLAVVYYYLPIVADNMGGVHTVRSPRLTEGTRAEKIWQDIGFKKAERDESGVIYTQSVESMGKLVRDTEHFSSHR